MKTAKLILLFLIFVSCNKDKNQIDLPSNLENLRVKKMTIGYDVSHKYHYSNNTIDSIETALDEYWLDRIFNYTDSKISNSTDVWTNDVLSSSSLQSEYLYEGEKLLQITSEEFHNGKTTTTIAYNEQDRIQDIKYVTVKDWSVYDIKNSSYQFYYDENFNVEKIIENVETIKNDSVTYEYEKEYIYEFDESINPFALFNQETILSLNYEIIHFWTKVNPFSQNNIKSVVRKTTNSTSSPKSTQYQYDLNSDNYPTTRYQVVGDEESNRVKYEYEYY